jgi:hypothetical protein
MAMFTKRTTAALFAIAIASSLIVASGGFVGSVFAAKKVSQKPDDDTYRTLSAGQDKSDSPKSQSANAGDLSGAIGDTSGLSSKQLKKLSKCQSDAAADGDLTLGEVKECYSQVSDQGQGQEQGKEDKSSAARGNDQSEDGQGQLVLGQG